MDLFLKKPIQFLMIWKHKRRKFLKTMIIWFKKREKFTVNLKEILLKKSPNKDSMPPQLLSIVTGQKWNKSIRKKIISSYQRLRLEEGKQRRKSSLSFPMTFTREIPKKLKKSKITVLFLCWVVLVGWKFEQWRFWRVKAVLIVFSWWEVIKFLIRENLLKKLGIIDYCFY